MKGEDVFDASELEFTSDDMSIYERGSLPNVICTYFNSIASNPTIPNERSKELFEI